MGPREQFNKELEHLEDQLEQGELTDHEYQERERELQREARWAAEEAAQRAYDEEMERW